MSRTVPTNSPLKFVFRAPWQWSTDVAGGPLTRAFETVAANILFSLKDADNNGIFANVACNALPTGITYVYNLSVIVITIDPTVYTACAPAGLYIGTIDKGGASTLSYAEPQTDCCTVGGLADDITDTNTGVDTLVTNLPTALSTMQTAITAIKGHTDNLPDNGALTAIAGHASTAASESASAANAANTATTRLGDPGVGNSITGMLQLSQFFATCDYTTDPDTGITTMSKDATTIQAVFTNADGSPVNFAQILNRVITLP